jgi:hypothetical protein
LVSVRMIPSRKEIAFVDFGDEASSTMAKDGLNGHVLEGKSGAMKVRLLHFCHSFRFSRLLFLLLRSLVLNASRAFPSAMPISLGHLRSKITPSSADTFSLSSREKDATVATTLLIESLLTTIALAITYIFGSAYCQIYMGTRRRERIEYYIPFSPLQTHSSSDALHLASVVLLSDSFITSSEGVSKYKKGMATLRLEGGWACRETPI